MAWFAKHWRLVRSLHTDGGPRDAAMHEAIEQGLADAAARCKGAVAAAQEGAPVSQLQSIQGKAPSLAVLCHLQAFTTLTSLRLHGINGMQQAHKPQACAALETLVNLRCLEINALTDCDLLPATSRLTNLTSLSALALTPSEGVPNLQYLPPQLQNLTMTLSILQHERHPVIDLGHVTGLTQLRAPAVKHSTNGGWVVGFRVGLSGEPKDKLPPNCRHLSVEDIMSAQPLLELQHLERLELQECELHDDVVQEAVLQLSSLSSLTDLQLNIAVGRVVDAEMLLELSADVLLALPSLRGLRLWYTGIDAEDCYDIEMSVLHKLAKLTALQRLSMSKLALPDSSELRLVDAVRGLRGLQSICLCGCFVPELASVMGAIGELPELRDLCLADFAKWDEAASAALAAATQLTGLMFVAGRENSLEFLSLVGQVHKLSGLRRLWMHSAGMDRLDVDALAASLTGLTELCLRDCDPHLLGPKFPRATLGCILPGCHLEMLGVDVTVNRSAFQVNWWSPEGHWEKD